MTSWPSRVTPKTRPWALSPRVKRSSVGALALVGVQLESVRVEIPGQPTFEDNFSGLGRSRVAQAGLTLLGGALGVFALARRVSWLIAASPLLLMAPLFRWDLRALLDSLRLIHVTEAAGPALLVGAPALGMLLAVASASLRLPHALALAAGVGAAVAAAFGGLSVSPAWATRERPRPEKLSSNVGWPGISTRTDSSCTRRTPAPKSTAPPW